MKCLIADDEPLIQRDIHRTAKKVFGESTEFFFAANTDEVLKIVGEQPLQIALLDIEMPFLGGIEVAKRIRELSPKTNVIFVTGHEKYALQAFGAYASDFIVKPINENSLTKAYENLRFPVSKLEVRCFGRFDVIANGASVEFKRSKCKEVMAYMIDKRGGEVPEDEFRFLLWTEEEDTEKKRRYVRNIMSEIRSALKEHGADNIILNNGKGSYRINREAISCDYYDYLDGKRSFPKEELQAYMEQYDWAETKRVSLAKK